MSTITFNHNSAISIDASKIFAENEQALNEHKLDIIKWYNQRKSNFEQEFVTTLNQFLAEDIVKDNLYRLNPTKITLMGSAQLLSALFMARCKSGDNEDLLQYITEANLFEMFYNMK